MQKSSCALNVGDRYTYYPPKKSQLDNQHPQCELVGFTKTGRARINVEDGRRVLAVNPAALSSQLDFFRD